MPVSQTKEKHEAKAAKPFENDIVFLSIGNCSHYLLCALFLSQFLQDCLPDVNLPKCGGFGYVLSLPCRLSGHIAWQKQCRITIQQIAWQKGLAETQDDWSTATFWYEPVPSAPLPVMPNVEARTADIWQEAK